MGPRRHVLDSLFDDKFLIDDGCWEWISNRDSRGYGQIRVEGRESMAHRVMYELFIGPIPDGLVLDHLCRNRGCVRPSHCEPVTFAENVRRGESPAAIAARRTHCARGHEFAGANLILRSDGGRRCRECKNARVRGAK